MRPERVIIAGGGIGGMALAAALQRLGVRFLVLERAAELGEVGAGLGVLPNAVRALVAIGVGTELFRDGGPFRRFRICNQAGEELKEVDFESFFRRLGGEGYVLHRAALHAALAKRVDSDAIRTGASVAAVEQSETEVRVHLEGDFDARGGRPPRRRRRAQLGRPRIRPRRWAAAVCRRNDLPRHRRGDPALCLCGSYPLRSSPIGS